MKKLILLFGLILLLINSNILAQPLSLKATVGISDVDPSTVGMSADRIAKIDAMLQKSVENKNVPGLVALIARNGKIVYHKAYGMSDNEAGKPMQKDAIFRIASQTKAVTSTAVMMLWEEGHFGLDDPIANYIPEFKNMQVLDSLVEADMSYTTSAANKPITIRHLLTHTSGLGYGVIDSDKRMKKIYAKAGVTDLFTTEDISIGESVKKLAKLPLHHHPGEKFTYSEGLDVLGYFIEIISGMPLDQFFKTRIFDPLGMADTWFYLPDAKKERLVKIHKQEDGKWINYPVTFYDPDYPIKGAKRFFSGGAGLSSTAKDYAIFLQMYLNNGQMNDAQLLSRTTIQFMMANHIGDLWGKESYHGLAFGVMDQAGQDKGGKGSKGTFEWGGYFNTQYFADPVEGVIGILMKQTQGEVTGDPIGQFRQMIWPAIID